MAPFNMASVAGLLATCAAVAASAAHLLPLLLLLICPRGTQAEQGKRSLLVRFTFVCLPLYSLLRYFILFCLPIYVGLIKPEMIVRGDTSGRDTSRPIATLGCILSQMYRVR